MKNTFKRCISVLLAFCIVLSSAYVGITEINYSSAFTIKAEAIDSDVLEFTLNDDETSYSVSCSDSSVTGEIVIPQTFDGLPVTAIEDSAFEGCEGITSVVIPEGIELISPYAFYNCYNLESVSIPLSVTYIGYGAFYNCEKLSFVFYNARKKNWYNILVESDNNNLINAVFHYNTTDHTYGDLQEIPTKCGIDGKKYFECSICDYKYITQKTTAPGHIWVDDVCTVCNIHKDVLVHSDHPYSDDFDYTWTINENGADHIAITFSEETLTEKKYDKIYIYDSNTDPDDCDCYYTGKELAGKRIVIFDDTVNIRFTSDESETNYGFDLVDVEFYYDECEHIQTKLYDAVSATCENNGYTGDTICVECQVLLNEGTEIPASRHTFVDNICEECGVSDWEYCNYGDFIAITSYNGFESEVIIPDTFEDLPVTIIEENAFRDCTYIEKLTIPSTVEIIGKDAFRDCNNIGEVYASDLDSWLNICFLEEDVDYAYSNPLQYGADLYIDGELLTDLVIPETVTVINPNTFIGCRSIESVTFHSGIETVGQRAFGDCYNLSVVDIEDLASWCNIDFVQLDNGNCTYYDSNPLANDANLYIDGEKIDELIIPDTVTELKNYTFVNCREYNFVYIPDSVDALSTQAFTNCIYLKDILYEGSRDDMSSIADLDYFTDSYRVHFNASPDHLTATVDTEPSCTVRGKLKISCDCGIDSYSEIPPVGHKWVDGVCSVCTFNKDDIIESVHPYPNNYDYTWTIYREGADRIAITFSDKTRTESGYDFIKIFDTEDECIGTYSGNELIGKRIVVPGDKITVTMNTDTSITYYGFEIINIEAFYTECCHSSTKIINECDPQCEDDGYSGDIYCIECQKILEYGDNIQSTGHSMVDNYCKVCGVYAWEYDIDGDFVTIIDYNGSENDVIIPETVEGLPVKTIGSEAFYNNKAIEKLTIPSTITKIGSYAFYGCENLSEVYVADLNSWLEIELEYYNEEQYFFHNYTSPLYYGADLYVNGELLTDLIIPETVTVINPYTFLGCSSLETVTFHNAVTSVGMRAFGDCPELLIINIPDIASWCNIDFMPEYDEFTDEVSSYDSNPLCNGGSLYIDGSKVKEIIVPDSVNALDSFTFVECDDFTWVYIPDSVELLSNYTFKGSERLTDILFEGTSEEFYEISDAAYYEDNYRVHYNTTPEHLIFSTISLPDCTTRGKIKVSCSCKEDYYITTPAYGHSWENDECTVCGFNETDIIESAHPYEDNFYGEWTIHREDAKRIAITFSEDTETEASCDIISIYDSEDNLIGTYSGTNFVGKKIVIPGDTVKITFSTDYSVVYYGFEIIYIEAFYGECSHPSTENYGSYAPTCIYEGYTGDTRCTECYEILEYGEEIPIDSDAHTMKSSRYEATCIDDGYTLYACESCFYSYKADIEPATGVHTYSNGLCKNCGLEEGSCSIDVLKLGETKIATLSEDDDYFYFYFTPEKNGVYSFTSDSDYDTYGYIYDESFKEIEYDDDDGLDANFKIAQFLEAGKKYVIGCRYYDVGTDGDFGVSCNYELYIKDDIKLEENFFFIPGGKSQITDLFTIADDITINCNPSFDSGINSYLGTGSEFEYNDEFENYKLFTLIVDGDLNGDSVCDVLDATMAQQYSVHYDEPAFNQIIAANGCVSEDIDATSYQRVVNLSLAS